MAFGKISGNLKRAVVTAEDGEFYRHNGFNWEAINRAWVEYQKGERRRGASTITMQLARNLFLGNSKNWVRKGLEAYYTVLLEFFLSKNRILELYLNVIEWGDGFYGAEAAARIYYHVPASGLSTFQAARLAACIPNPRRFNPLKESPYLDWYTAHIEGRMGGVAMTQSPKEAGAPAPSVQEADTLGISPPVVDTPGVGLQDSISSENK